jgi:hypothetical protein
VGRGLAPIRALLTLLLTAATTRLLGSCKGNRSVGGQE